MDETETGANAAPEGDDMAKREALLVTGPTETEAPEPTRADLVIDQCAALIRGLGDREINAVMVRLRHEFGG